MGFPFRYNSVFDASIPSNNPMIIDGVLYESSFKVMTLNGRVIREITSEGTSKDGPEKKN